MFHKRRRVCTSVEALYGFDQSVGRNRRQGIIRRLNTAAARALFQDSPCQPWAGICGTKTGLSPYTYGFFIDILTEANVTNIFQVVIQRD